MHFTSHHCKATALRTGACSFYCSVERQDVGLEGNAINHADAVGNLAAADDLPGALLHKSISGQAPPNPSRGYATAAV